jgi:tRNA1(Val) A37 N6-methylase TrmN6
VSDPAAFSEGELTADGFLGGRLTVRQPREGFRSSVDAVLLAAAVPGKAGQSVLDIGCGAGVAALCLGARIPGVALAGIEIQPPYAELARRNGTANGIVFSVWTGDIARMPADLRTQVFDHVLMNPPYFRAGDGTASRDGGREAALRTGAAMADWIGAGLKRLRPGGHLTLIQTIERLPEALAALPSHGAGGILLPILPRQGRSATRFILQVRKGGRSAFRLLAPFVLHAGESHLRDGDDYTPEARAILRDGAALDLSAR